MLKIPKQIYFDQTLLELYSQYARQTGKSFAAVVRETLDANHPKIVTKKKPSLLNFYGAGKSPYKRRFSAREEHSAFYKAIAKNAVLEEK